MYAAIIDRFNQTLQSIPGALPLVKENTKGTKQLLQPYMRSTFMPGLNSQVTQGSRIIRFGGLVQVDCFYPANTDANQAFTDTLVAYFLANPFLQITAQSNMTVLMASRGVGNVETDWYRVPVTVEWEWFSA